MFPGLWHEQQILFGGTTAPSTANMQVNTQTFLEIHQKRAPVIDPDFKFMKV